MKPLDELEARARARLREAEFVAARRIRAAGSYDAKSVQRSLRQMNTALLDLLEARMKGDSK